MNQLPRGRSHPLSVALHPRLDCQRRLQCGDGVAGLALLPESDDGVGHEQDENDHQVRPVPDDTGEDDRPFDHPRDGPPEVAEELEERVALLFLDFIGTDGRQALPRLCLTEAIW